MLMLPIWAIAVLTVLVVVIIIVATRESVRYIKAYKATRDIVDVISSYSEETGQFLEKRMSESEIPESKEPIPDPYPTFCLYCERVQKPTQVCRFCGAYIDEVRPPKTER